MVCMMRTIFVSIICTMLPCVTLIVLLALCPAAINADDCPAEREVTLHDEAKLHKDLFCAYAYYDFRPVKDHKSAVNVKIRFAIKYLSFDDLEETFTLHSWVAMTWKDEYLTWNPVDYGNIKEIQVESHEFWTPRMALFNADATMINSDQIYTTCLVDHEGTVTCVPHLTHSGICSTPLQKWPYDEINCTLFFGSWMHTGEQVNFTFYQKHPVVMDGFQNGPGWKLMSTANERLPGTYTCCPNSTYPMLKYTFILKRMAAGPAAIIVVPSIIIVLLTLMSLVLDVKDNTRLMLISFSLFGHFMFLSEIGYNIPKHSETPPIILLFLKDSMIVTFVGLAETVFLMSLRKRIAPAPSWMVSITRLVNSGPGKYIVFTEFDPADVGDAKVLSEEGPNSTNDENAKGDWIQFASILNSVLSLVAVLTYLILIVAYIPRDD